MNINLMPSLNIIEEENIINNPPSIIKKEETEEKGKTPYSKPSIFSYWQYPAFIRQALGKDLILSYLEEFSTQEAVYAVGKALFTPYVSLLENNPAQCLYHASTSAAPPFMVEFQLEKYSYRLRAACQFYRNFIGNPLNKNAV